MSEGKKLNAAAAEMARARAASLTPERRAEIAQKAAEARWGKKKAKGQKVVKKAK